MDIDRALRAMDSSSRELCRQNLELYNRTGDRRYAEEILAILRNFDDEPDVQAWMQALSR